MSNEVLFHFVRKCGATEVTRLAIVASVCNGVGR
jgi:hypothetical protein